MLNSQLPLHQSLPLGIEKYPGAIGNPIVMPLAAVQMRAVEKVGVPLRVPILRLATPRRATVWSLEGEGRCPPESTCLQAEVHNDQFSLSCPHPYLFLKPEFIRELATQVCLQCLFMEIMCTLYSVFCSVGDSGSCLSKKTPRRLLGMFAMAPLESRLAVSTRQQNKDSIAGVSVLGG